MGRCGCASATGRAALAVLLLVICAPLYAAPAGKVLYARGNVSAQAPGGGLSIIASGAPVAVGDAVSTAEESFALIELIDHERITLRPDTTFAITAFDQTAGQESVALNLLKGGIRALTGLFGKRRPDSFRLTTPVATIGIRGTDFSARICGPECPTDSATARVATPLTHIVARWRHWCRRHGSISRARSLSDLGNRREVVGERGQIGAHSRRKLRLFSSHP